MSYDLILELVSHDVTRVWPYSDDGQRWIHKHEDLQIYEGGPLDSDPAFAQELAAQAQATGLAVLVNDVIGRTGAASSSSGDGNAQWVRMRVTRRAATNIWFRQILDDCSLTSATLPNELEMFFGVSSANCSPTALQVAMTIGAMCYSSLFIGPIYGNHIDDEMQKTWIPALALAAEMAKLPNATPQGIWERYINIARSVSDANADGKNQSAALAPVIAAWMVESLPLGAKEGQRAEIVEWVAQEVGAYLGFASSFWSDFAAEHTLLDG